MIALAALRSAATTRNQYVPGSLNRAVVDPQSAAGGFWQTRRNVPSGTSRPVGPGAVSWVLVPSPNVTVPGPRYLLHHTLMRAPVDRRATTAALAGAGYGTGATTIGESWAAPESGTVTSRPAEMPGAGGSPTSSE
jgi:hypothetical protein